MIRVASKNRSKGPGHEIESLDSREGASGSFMGSQSGHNGMTFHVQAMVWSEIDIILFWLNSPPPAYSIVFEIQLIRSIFPTYRVQLFKPLKGPSLLDQISMRRTSNVSFTGALLSQGNDVLKSEVRKFSTLKIIAVGIRKIIIILKMIIFLSSAKSWLRLISE